MQIFVGKVGRCRFSCLFATMLWGGPLFCDGMDYDRPLYVTFLAFQIWASLCLDVWLSVCSCGHRLYNNYSSVYRADVLWPSFGDRAVSRAGRAGGRKCVGGDFPLSCPPWEFSTDTFVILPPYHLTTLQLYHLTTLPPYNLTTLTSYHLNTLPP